MRTSGALCATLAAALVLASTSAAHAFCRTTTCSPDDPNAQCAYDANGCETTGKPLYWTGACVSFSVQKDGSPLRHISEETADKVISTGFSQWMGANCGSGHPSITVYDRGKVSCNKHEYNQHHGNANIFMFRDDKWPYPTVGAGTEELALSTVTYNTQTGAIYDVDVEVNSIENQITVGDQNVAYDLQSILTHEIGHFLGLAHSPDPNATMTTEYTYGDTSLRTLSQDDVNGICAIYPPGRNAGKCDPTPRHGYSSQCKPSSSGGCRTAGPGLPGEPWNAGSIFGALVALGLLARRRRRPG